MKDSIKAVFDWSFALLVFFLAWFGFEGELLFSLLFVGFITVVVMFVIDLLLLVIAKRIGKKSKELFIHKGSIESSVNLRLRLVAGVFGLICSLFGSLISNSSAGLVFAVFLFLFSWFEIFFAFNPSRVEKKKGGVKTANKKKPNNDNKEPTVQEIILSVTIDIIDNLSGEDFEIYCGYMMSIGGFEKVVVTDSKGDHGADIVAHEKEGVVWVVQCKRYSSNLGNSPIQEVVASKPHYNAQRAAVITNSSFTKGAITLAFENEVVLIDRRKLDGIIARGRGLTLGDMR